MAEVLDVKEAVRDMMDEAKKVADHFDSLSSTALPPGERGPQALPRPLAPDFLLAAAVA